MFSGHPQMHFFTQGTMSWSWARQGTPLLKFWCPLLSYTPKVLRKLELLWEFWNTADAGAAIIFGALKDILYRLNLTIYNCLGNSMSAYTTEQRQALNVDCLVHIFNLFLLDVSEKEGMCRGFLGLIFELTDFVTCSSKHLHLFQVF